MWRFLQLIHNKQLLYNFVRRLVFIYPSSSGMMNLCKEMIFILIICINKKNLCYFFYLICLCWLTLPLEHILILVFAINFEWIKWQISIHTCFLKNKAFLKLQVCHHNIHISDLFILNVKDLLRKPPLKVNIVICYSSYRKATL